MSKFKVFAQIFGVVAIFVVVTSCSVGQQPAGIPPAQATIWALNTQLAVQATSAASTLTAVANDNVAAKNAQPQPQPLQPVAIALPASTQEPFSFVIDPAAAATGATVNCTVKATNVDLRTGPDVRFTFGGHHVAGEACVISAKYYDWYFVTFPSNDSKGWLYLGWLNVSDPAGLAAIPQILVNTDWKWMQSCKKYCR
jgi:hypothetical protein